MTITVNGCTWESIETGPWAGWSICRTRCVARGDYRHRESTIKVAADAANALVSR